jgi:hypothetical protein
MAQPNVTLLWNSGTNDTPNTGGASGDGNFKVFDPVNDKISWQSEAQSDGAPNTVKRVWVIPESGTGEIDKTFVNDYSAGIFDQVPLAGSNRGKQNGGNTRYVFCVFFDGPTLTAPELQAWDDENHNSVNNVVLGAGTPGNSMIRAVATTNAPPGSADWLGTPLAGSGAENVIQLDTDALAGSKNLYFNVRVAVPSGTQGFTAAPVLSVYYTYS